MYRHGSDSLLGRYHHFRLHPFSLAELLKNKYSADSDQLIDTIFNENNIAIATAQKQLNLLFI